jgi:hypothetical protein
MVVLTSLAFAAPSTPFKGSWDSAETSTFDFSGVPTMYVDGQAWGNATHLGNYTATFEATVNLDLFSSEGDTVEFTAADGSTLSGLGSGSGAPAMPGYNYVVQTYEITGGSGRFEGATGSFTVHRWVNLATGISYGSFDGTLVMATGKK